ncbi:HAD-IA family hydrolase [Oceanospirillaceae bacterium]|nr:HAD-IA family hydrolase [Oceanospirillaceae bacterium]MDB9753745.1 HAD-IA family hydrolase [Oceanospirillaceae bacterium]MDC1341429.1 HAD-IA family hydrolase [Oceanospirillaceae bacterium]
MKDQTALVLDFGGVISRTLFETHLMSEKALGLPKGCLTWQGPFSVEKDALWQSMQNDEISERDYWLFRAKEVGQMIGEDWTTMQQFVQAARGDDVMAVIRTEFLTTLNVAKKEGYKLAILSNELDLFYGKTFRTQCPFLKDFDLIIDATYTEILKPDPRAYELITEGLGLKAEQCIFVDDQLRNIQGAEAAGMQTVHFNVMQPDESYELALKLLAQEGNKHD